jgi:hypothetical protein
MTMGALSPTVVPVDRVSPEARVYKCNLRPEDMPEALVFVKIFALVT